tara:strand:- start:37 stop:243 length:207 start_codon:yes stop_codon:yes gene_type:complete
MSGGMQGGGAEPILTTKGDTLTFSTEEIRNPIGVDGEVLMADSTVPLGVAWSVPAAGGSPIWEIMVYG